MRQTSTEPKLGIPPCWAFRLILTSHFTSASTSAVMNWRSTRMLPARRAASRARWLIGVSRMHGRPLTGSFHWEQPRVRRCRMLVMAFASPRCSTRSGTYSESFRIHTLVFQRYEHDAYPPDRRSRRRVKVSAHRDDSSCPGWLVRPEWVCHKGTKITEQLGTKEK